MYVDEYKYNVNEHNKLAIYPIHSYPSLSYVQPLDNIQYGESKGWCMVIVWLMCSVGQLCNWEFSSRLIEF